MFDPYIVVELITMIYVSDFVIHISSIYMLFTDTWSRLMFFYFLKKVHLVQFFEKKTKENRLFVFFLKIEYGFSFRIHFRFNLHIQSCVNNGTCNCVQRFDRFVYVSYLNCFIFRYWSNGSNAILLEWSSDNRVTYIYVSIGMDI